MLKQLPLKKEYLLVAASFLLLLICYELAFKKTIEAWQLNYSLKQQLSQSTDISNLPGYQERKNNNLEKIIELYKADTTDFRSKIISDISAIAEKENVKLTEVPIQNSQYHSAQSIIQKLNFEGDYFSLIKVFNRLQSTKEVGLIRSVDLKTITIPSNGDKAKKLVLEIYFEVSGSQK